VGPEGLCGGNRPDPGNLRQVIPDKERIDALAVATGQYVTLLPAEPAQGDQRCAMVIHRRGNGGFSGFSIRDGYRTSRTERCIVFDDHDARRDRINRRPQPVIAAVNVNRQQIDLLWYPASQQQIIDILRRDGALILQNVLEPAQLQQIEEETWPNIEATEPAIDLLTVCRSLERIGDHCTNIAEDIIVVIEGSIVRHSKVT